MKKSDSHIRLCLGIELLAQNAQRAVLDLVGWVLGPQAYNGEVYLSERCL